MVIVRKIVYGLLSFMNLFIPKQNRVFIYGGQELTGNSEAMLWYLAENTDIDVVCITNEKIRSFEKYRNVKFKSDSILNAMFAYFTSRVVLDSSLHTVKMRPTKKQVSIQLWHGSPLKHLPKSNTIKNGKYYTRIAYASDLFKNEMKQSFGIDDDQLLLIGNPRNDLLFQKTELPSSCSDGRKLIVWMPTFRRGIGLQEASRDIPIVTKDNCKDLERFLKEHKIRLFIKPHPLQMGGLSELFDEGEYEAIHLLTDVELRQNGLTLYGFLGQMDALLTDYSSVYFDYLLLNRPIGFAIDDIDEYSKSRGFALDPPEKYMPGKKIRNYQDLIDFLSDVETGRDEYQADREQVNEQVNYYKDGDSSERCYRLIVDALNN